MRRVVAFGTFDGIHPGHEHYLREARMHGDHLRVGIARDETGRQVNGQAPSSAGGVPAFSISSAPHVGNGSIELLLF